MAVWDTCGAGGVDIQCCRLDVNIGPERWRQRFVRCFSDLLIDALDAVCTVFIWQEVDCYPLLFQCRQDLLNSITEVWRRNVWNNDSIMTMISYFPIWLPREYLNSVTLEYFTNIVPTFFRDAWHMLQFVMRSLFNGIWFIYSFVIHVQAVCLMCNFNDRVLASKLH